MPICAAEMNACMATLKQLVDGTGRVLRTTGSLLRSPDRINEVKTIARWLTFLEESQAIPEQFLVDIFPGIGSMRASLALTMKHNWELPYGEKVILVGIVRLLAPNTLFEFGTATGETSVLLADAAPEGAVVHTVDLPEELDPEIGAGAVGQAFKDRPEYANVIVQHRVDLRSFDSEPFRGTVDFIFIDAAHDFNSVTQDSELALKMLRPGGCIVWDDYQPSQWGTVKALNELNKSHPLVRIAYSRFVVLRSTAL